MAAMAPTSAPDQLLWSPCVTPLPSKVMGSKIPSLTSGMPRVGMVFHLSNPGLATESSPRPGAAKQHQQLATAPNSLCLSSSIPSNPAEGDSDDVVAVEDPGSMGDWDRDPRDSIEG